MPSQEQESVLDLSVLSSQLLAESEVLQRALLLVRFVAGLLPESAVSLYTLADNANSTYWIPRATFGEATIHEEAIHSEFGLLGHLLVDAAPILPNRAEIRREDCPHVEDLEVSWQTARRKDRLWVPQGSVETGRLLQTPNAIEYSAEQPRWRGPGAG